MNLSLRQSIEERARPKRILLVEDDEATQSLFDIYARKLWCEVVSVSKATDALEILRDANQRVDFALLDLMLPDITGEEIFRLIRSEPISANRPDLPVAILSGFITDEVRQRMKQVGFCVFIEKPHAFTEHYVLAMLKTFGIQPRIDNVTIGDGTHGSNI